MKFDPALKAATEIVRRVASGDCYSAKTLSEIIEALTATTEMSYWLEELFKNIPDDAANIVVHTPGKNPQPVGLVNIWALRATLKKARKV